MIIHNWFSNVKKKSKIESCIENQINLNLNLNLKLSQITSVRCTRLLKVDGWFLAVDVPSFVDVMDTTCDANWMSITSSTSSISSTLFTSTATCNTCTTASSADWKSSNIHWWARRMCKRYISWIKARKKKIHIKLPFEKSLSSRALFMFGPFFFI